MVRFKHKKYLSAAFLVFTISAVLLTPVLAHAASAKAPPAPAPTATDTPNTVKNDCNGPKIKAKLPETDENHCGILDYLVLFIQILSGIVGVAVVASIIIGGIQYSMSGDDPSAVAAAKKRITNAIIALGLYAFAFAFLEYLIPGGVL